VHGKQHVSPSAPSYSDVANCSAIPEARWLLKWSLGINPEPTRPEQAEVLTLRLDFTSPTQRPAGVGSQAHRRHMPAAAFRGGATVVAGRFAV
jgi:hypothetical protein